MTVTSRITSHRPRVTRKIERSRRGLPRCHQRKAPSPAVNMKTGAQKCVTQRVMNNVGVVVARLVGDDDIAARWMKSRTWSSAMMIMIRPRTASIESRRVREVSVGTAPNVYKGVYCVQSRRDYPQTV